VEEPGQSILCSKVDRRLSHLRVSLIVGAKAVDFFSIATCEVSEAGSSLIVKGKRSGSLLNKER